MGEILLGVSCVLIGFIAASTLMWRGSADLMDERDSLKRRLDCMTDLCGNARAEVVECRAAASRWEDTACLYASNADHWEEKHEAAKAEAARLRNIICQIKSDVDSRASTIGKEAK